MIRHDHALIAEEADLTSADHKQERGDSTRFQADSN